MKFLRIIYWISIFLICFWVFLPLIKSFLSLEITDHEIEDTYDLIRFWGLPVAILLTLTGTIKQDDTSDDVGGKVSLTLFVAGFSLFFVLLFNMCDWSTSIVLFQNKEDSDIKIVEREYGCGATDGGEPIYKIFKVQELTKYFIRVTEIDTATIGRAEWERVEKH